MSQGLSSSSSTSKRPSDGEQSYHRQQAKRRLTEINGKMAEAEDRLGRLTRELNTRRDLERRAQAAREEVARLKCIRKEYKEHRFQDSFQGTSRPAQPGPQQQSKLQGKVLDGIHLLELHRGTSIKFILIILVVALIALAVGL